MQSSPYRLNELGWLQFDRLCSLVLEAEVGLSDLRWRGRGDVARIALIDGQVALRGRPDELAGPVTLLAVWVRDGQLPERRVAEFTDHVIGAQADLGTWPDGDVLVLTNLEHDEAVAALPGEGVATTRVVLGAGEISEILDRDPGLRVAMPSVLGLRDLDDLIDPETRDRSSVDVERAQQLARVSGRRARTSAPASCWAGIGSWC